MAVNIGYKQFPEFDVRNDPETVYARFSKYAKRFKNNHLTGAPNDNFRKNICSEDDLRSRIFGTFVVKFLACLPLLGFSNI